MSKNDVKLVLKLNPDLELKQLGTIMGLPIYIDTASVRLDEDKFQSFLQAQTMLSEFFHPPEVTKDTERGE